MVMTATAADRARCGVDIARQPLSFDLLQVFLPQFVVMLAQIVEKVPGVEAAVVSVREDEAHGVGADRFDALDVDVALAGLQCFLARAVTTCFRRRGVHPQVLEIQFEALAALVGDLEQA